MRYSLAALFVITALAAGCQSSTPLQRVTAARQTYTATLNSLTPLINSGVISDPDELRGIRDATRTVPPLLDTAEIQAVHGEASVTTTLGQINAWLDTLTKYLSKQRPATRPTALNDQETPWTPLRSSLLFRLASPA